MVNDIDLKTSDLVRGVEELRRADAQLARRLTALRAPNDTDRTAMRLIVDAPESNPITPRDLAEHLNISTAAITNVIRRLSERGQIVVAPHPADARSKVLRPSLRDMHSPADELSMRIDAVASEFTPEQSAAIGRFLRRLVEEISELP
nr:MarR family transcriptional regulator [uncultured Microbacterium sp.]